ncbi:MAG: hypothetical protein ACYCSF_14045 [Acidimicrobiales bacterium]
MTGAGDVTSSRRRATSSPEEVLALRHATRHRLQVALAIVCAVAAVLLAGILAGEGVRAQIDARLRAAGAGANTGLVLVESEQLSLLREISFTAGVGTALAARDSVVLDRLVTPLQVNSGVPMVDVVLADGQVILAVRSRGAPRPVASRKGLRVISRSLALAHGVRGGRFSEMLILRHDPTMVTVGPLLAGSRPVGVVLVMTPLADVLGRLGSEVRATLTAYSETGIPLATTSRSNPPPVNPETAAGIFAGRAVAVRETSGDTREALGRLIVDHGPVAVLGVSMHDDSVVTEIYVDACGGAGLVLVALLFGVPAWRRRRHELREARHATT